MCEYVCEGEVDMRYIRDTQRVVVGGPSGVLG